MNKSIKPDPVFRWSPMCSKAIERQGSSTWDLGEK